MPDVYRSAADFQLHSRNVLRIRVLFRRTIRWVWSSPAQSICGVVRRRTDECAWTLICLDDSKTQQPSQVSMIYAAMRIVQVEQDVRLPLERVWRWCQRCGPMIYHW